jgi:hypothetical protein
MNNTTLFLIVVMALLAVIVVALTVVIDIGRAANVNLNKIAVDMRYITFHHLHMLESDNYGMAGTSVTFAQNTPESVKAILCDVRGDVRAIAAEVEAHRAARLFG